MNKETLKITLSVLILLLVVSMGIYGYVHRNELMDKFQSLNKKQTPPVEKIERQTVNSTNPTNETKNNLEPVKLDKPVNQILSVDEKNTTVVDKEKSKESKPKDLLPVDSNELEPSKKGDHHKVTHDKSKEMIKDEKDKDSKSSKSKKKKSKGEMKDTKNEDVSSHSMEKNKDKKQVKKSSIKTVATENDSVRRKRLEKRIEFLEKAMVKKKKKPKSSLSKLERRVMKLEKAYLNKKKRARK